MRRIDVAAGLMAGLLAGGASAATVVTMESNMMGPTPKSQTMVIEPDRMRMESGEGGMIFRGDQQKIVMLHAKDHSYTEMTPESMSRMPGQMDQAMARMQQQMASMPPEQRKQMEKMMGGRGMGGMGPGAGAPQHVEYRRNGEPRSVGAWNCVPYDVIVDNDPTMNICVAKLSALGLDRSDLASFEAFSEMMRKQFSGMGGGDAMASMNFDSLTKAIGYEAFPVETVVKSPMGGGDMRTTVTSVTHKDVPASTFEIPAGFTKQDMGMGRGHMGPPGGDE